MLSKLVYYKAQALLIAACSSLYEQLNVNVVKMHALLNASVLLLFYISVTCGLVYGMKLFLISQDLRHIPGTAWLYKCNL